MNWVFSESGVTSITPLSVHEHIQRDEAASVVLVVDGLAALASRLVQSRHINALDQFPQGIGCPLLDAHILVGFLDKKLDILMLSFLYFDFLL